MTSNLIYCSCIICKAEYEASNLRKHLRFCTAERVIHKSKLKSLECEYCNKTFNTASGRGVHQSSCRLGPSPRDLSYNNSRNKGRAAWNKGLTAENNESIMRQKETFQNNIALGKHVPKGSPHTEEFKENQRIRAIERGLGGVRQSKKILYNGVTLGSTYEVSVAKSLDENGIKWNIPDRLYYTDNSNKRRSYTADFYLPDYDVYLDPKNDFLINNVNPRLGFRDTDKIKWCSEQNNKKIIILDKNHLTWNKIVELL